MENSKNNEQILPRSLKFGELSLGNDDCEVFRYYEDVKRENVLASRGVSLDELRRNG